MTLVAKSAHGVPRTSPRCLGHPARNGFVFGLGTQKSLSFKDFPFFPQSQSPHRYHRLYVTLDSIVVGSNQGF